MKQFAFFAILLAGAFIFLRPVFAHVVIEPKEAVIGDQTITIQIPAEKDIPTTEVWVTIPESVDVDSVMPIPGWTHTETREAMTGTPSPVAGGQAAATAQGRVSEIRWTGGKIEPGEFMHFVVSIAYANDPAKIAFKAYQKYSDGSVVAWDDTSEKNPAPKVEFLKESRLDTLSGNVEKINAAPQSPLLPIVAVILSVAALGMSLRKKG